MGAGRGGSLKVQLGAFSFALVLKEGTAKVTIFFLFLGNSSHLEAGILRCCRHIITQLHQRLLLPMLAFTVYAVHCVFKLQTVRVSGGSREMSDKCTSNPFAESLMPL